MHSVRDGCLADDLFLLMNLPTEVAKKCRIFHAVAIMYGMQLPTDADLLAITRVAATRKRLSARWSSVTLAWFTPQHCGKWAIRIWPKKSARPCSSCLLARLPA